MRRCFLSNYVELEIQNLLNSLGTSLSNPSELPQVGQKLIEGLENSSEHFTAENIKAASLFLLNSGQHKALISFYFRHLENPEFPFVWSHFLQSLSTQKNLLTEKLLAAIQEALEETSGMDEASRSSGAQQILPDLKPIQAKIQKDRLAAYQADKQQLLDQLFTLRTQQLYQQEKALLNRLQKLYPGDPAVKKEVQEHKQRYALEVLQRHSPQNRKFAREDVEVLAPDVAQALQILNADLLVKAEAHPEIAIDLCLLAIMLESYETALHILEYCEETPSSWWLRMEVLLRCRRYLELLTDLSRLEVLLAHDAETFFASAYLRAQALWGLGQKHTATEVLEGLLAARPNYRSASALFGAWSQG